MSIELNGTTGITTPAETVSGAVTAATVTATGLISGATNYTGFKNRIINGNMAIDQRNAGASVTAVNGAYQLDRWQTYSNQASKFSVQQNAGAVTPPTGFAKYIGVTSLSAYSVLVGDYFALIQNIEGFNFADLGWGTASASTITISFWVRSSLTGTFGGSLQNSASDRSYPFTYAISVANTWEQKTITIAGDTTGTWIGATNGIGVRVQFGLGVGTTNSGTAGAWSGTSYLSATGATSVVGTNGATFYITGVQLEKGSTATSFDYRPYGTELALCQRYYYTAASGAPYTIGVGLYYSAAQMECILNFPVPMRTAPSLVVASGAYYVIDRDSASDFLSGFAIYQPTTTSTMMYNNSEASGTSGHAGYVYTNNASGYVAFSSEL